MAILKSLHSLDNRQFVKGLSESERRSRKAGQKISRHARQMTDRFHRLTGGVVSLRGAIGALAGSAGIALLVRQQMKQIQTTQRVSEVSGFASSTIEALTLQSSKFGISQERVNDALIDFSERIGEARTGTGEAVDAIEQLEELSGRQIDITQNASKVWEDYVAALNEVDDASDRASIAAQVGGDALRDILPVINEGSEAFRDAAAQTEAMGLAFDDIDAAKVEAANDAIADMKGSFTGMARIVTIELAQPIQAVADSMNEAMAGSQEFQQSVRGMTRSAVGAVAAIIDASADVIDFINQHSTMAQFGLVGFVLFGKKGVLIGSMIGELFSIMRKEVAKLTGEFGSTAGKLVQAEERLANLQTMLESMRDPEQGGIASDEAIARQRQAIEETEKVVASLREQLAPSELKEFDERWASSSASVSNMAEGMRAVSAAMREALETSSQMGGASLGIRGAGGFGGGQEEGDGDGGAKLAEEEMERQQKRLDAIRQSQATEMELERTHFEREREFLQTAHESLFESEKERKNMLLELERNHEKRKFQIQTQGLGRLFNQQMQFLDSMEQAQKSSGMTQVGIMTNAFAQITAAGAQHNREMFEMNKAAGIANAVISTLVAANKTWEQWGYPWGIPMVAAQLAAGYANVQAIRSQSFTGGGGAAPSTSAGGGVPAVQDVSGQGGQEQRPQQNVTIEIAGDDDRLLSKRQLRRLMEDMQEELGDDASVGNVRIA